MTNYNMLLMNGEFVTGNMVVFRTRQGELLEALTNNVPVFYSIKEYNLDSKMFGFVANFDADLSECNILNQRVTLFNPDELVTITGGSTPT